MTLSGCGNQGTGKSGGGDEVARFKAWQHSHAMPAAVLEAIGPATPAQGGNRIAGPAWLEAGESWPAGPDGKPMIFLAQIDFAELPHLPDYPDKGVLQFFIGRDIQFGCNFDDPSKGTFKVIWREPGSRDGKLQAGPMPDPSGSDCYTPIQPAAGTEGISLRGSPINHVPDSNSWLLTHELWDVGTEEGRLAYNAVGATGAFDHDERHHVGGYPEFTQYDWRYKPEYHDVDRVLLNLWSDRYLMWGDMGQGQFMIRRADLLKRDFSRTYYQFDCS